MNLNDVIKTWKEADSTSESSPVGEPMVDKNLISKVRGGGSSGFICTLSGECQGFSCSPFARIR